MIRHLFTLIWNRRRANILLITEIFLAFVVLFVVGSLLVYHAHNYRTPLGFGYTQVWRINLDPGALPEASRVPTLRQVMARLRAMPEVVAVGRASGNTPFSGSTNGSDVGVGKEGNNIMGSVSGHLVEEDLREVLELPLVAGRWFDKRDDAATVRPAVISRDLGEALFPGQSALGKIVGRNGEELRVVGLIERFRADGDLEEARPAILMRVSPQDTVWGEAPVILLRVRPRADAALERQMNREILNIAKGWSVGITTLSEQRAAQLKRTLTPIVALVIVCLFLVVNVALGLFGVLWQTIQQRRAEIGVRRAMGATAGAISWQIVGEILVVATFGLALGLLVAAQFPLLGVFNVQAGVYGTAMLLAVGMIYLLTALCALYPSRLAAGIHPAVALREE
ncbi:FtsX-like permease family protein [Hymenobacter weizhouensis]|uniref:FtsX-like permease family protein n=1 Tax=Hymenobacter sp. YIM 151500-1 TaxID=2987689 RepID=UPI002226141B|nr:FtsX-like permease family protein [Hymenobacter sp. YIM 151500-1]UYZ64477.1 ABC transporter permease [Hymenobacter sp. YIM 151500-1]